MKICINCTNYDSCKASRTMHTYPNPVPCVWYKGPLSNEVKNYKKHNNAYLNQYFNPTYFDIIPKESSRYPVFNRFQLPKYDNTYLDMIYLKNFDTDQTDISKAELRMCAEYSRDIRAISEISDLTPISQYDPELFKFFGKQYFNGKENFVYGFSFRTDTSGISGPDWALNVMIRNNYDFYLYAYEEEIDNIKYFIDLFDYICNKNIIKKKLFSVIDNGVFKDSTCKSEGEIGVEKFGL